MALYFLDYDLRGSRNYEELYQTLKRFNAVRVLESQWCFNRINTNAAGLRDFFRKLVDADDGISVAEVSSWATYRTLGSPKQL